MKLIDPTCPATMLPWLRRFNELYIARTKELANGCIKAEALGIVATSDCVEVAVRIPAYKKAISAEKDLRDKLVGFFDAFYKANGAEELTIFIAQLVEYADNPKLLNWVKR